MNIHIIIPSYNEADNLKILIPQLKSVMKTIDADYRVSVIDAMFSDDGTQKICNEFGINYFRQKNIGYADAFRLGISLTNEELLLVVDSDNSQDISKIPQMYKAILSGADIAIGSRYIKGGTTEDPMSSVLMSKLLNNTYRLVLGFKEKDISTDFRLYKAPLLKNIETRCKNFDVIEETLFLIKKQYPDIIIKEVPTAYRKRLEGRSKRRLLSFIAGYIRLLLRLTKIKRTGR